MKTELESARGGVDPNALHYQEILFSLVMSVVAVLGRANPLLRFPDILWAFAGMLVFNLAYHRLLRGRAGMMVPLVSMAVNVLLISLVVNLSGGDQSSFWPLYLLPVFTACLHLERRHVLGACVAAGAFLACFYLDAFWQHRRWETGEFFLKIVVLWISAGVTAQLSFKERAHRAELAGIRDRLDAVARTLQRKTARDLQAMRQQSLETLIPGLTHALGNPVGIILGSVDLLLQDAPPGSDRRRDLERVREAARRCAQIGEDLRAYVETPAARSR